MLLISGKLYAVFGGWEICEIVDKENLFVHVLLLYLLSFSLHLYSIGAGIPDFRSPGTGLYDNLQKYNLPYPEAIFDISFYRETPQPFVTLAKELWPGIQFSPTLTHSFLKLLSDKGLLLRLYTQNIDGLEFLAGIPEEQLVECHGHFRTAACIECKTTTDSNRVKETIVVEGETPLCMRCEGNVKPDIGECTRTTVEMRVFGKVM